MEIISERCFKKKAKKKIGNGNRAKGLGIGILNSNGKIGCWKTKEKDIIEKRGE